MRISDWSSDVCSSDLDHLGAGFDLLQGDFQGLGVVLLADQAGELGGAGDVGALADVDEQRAAVDGERLQTRESAGLEIEERRVGNECVSECRSRWAPYH